MKQPVEVQGLADGYSIYVHIPFCKKICPYCDFPVEVLRKKTRRKNATNWQAFTDALCAHFDTLYPIYAGYTAPRSLYLGGGTPSLMPLDCIERLFTHIGRRLSLSVHELELTMEVEPNTLELEDLVRLRELGVNRLSLGWQSTQAEQLVFLGRRHRYEDSKNMAANCREAGFDNISYDLMINLPKQNIKELAVEIDELLAQNPPHVSLYSLTLHEGTPFYRHYYEHGHFCLPNEDEQAENEAYIFRRLEAAGLFQYEISNFSRVGFRSLHNQGYWHGRPCLAIGPGATGTWGDMHRLRYVNTASSEGYIAKIGADELNAGCDILAFFQDNSLYENLEQLTPIQQLAEDLSCILRTTETFFVPSSLAKMLTIQSHQYFWTAVARLKKQGYLLSDEHSYLASTVLGRRVADGMVELLWPKDKILPK